MNAIILNGARKEEASLDIIHDITISQLKDKSYQVDSLKLNELEIGNCTGCFGCWVKTPGICVIDDIGREIAKSIIQSDLVVYLTPIVFGGPSSELKKALDRIIPLLLPFFKKIDGEVHHEPRYDKYPSVVVLGVLPEKDAEMEGIFKTLLGRNALNWYNSHYKGDILYYTSPEDVLKDQINNLLGNMGLEAC